MKERLREARKHSTPAPPSGSEEAAAWDERLREARKHSTPAPPSGSEEAAA